MKRIFHALIAALLCTAAAAQECDMPFGVIIPEQAEQLDRAAEQQIKNKLRHIVTQNGIVAGIDASPFAITASVDVTGKEIISGAPTKYAYTFDVNLFIVNTRDKKILSSTSVAVNGVGDSRTKAYVAAIKQLNAGDTDVQACISSGKNKILAYYDANYVNIIKEAEACAALKNYDEAIYLLQAVPSCCNGYDAVVDAMSDVYQRYVDECCYENIALAQAAWMAGFTPENAAKAGTYLSEIYPDAACYDDAMELYAEIKGHMGEEWQFKMKQWDDVVDIEAQRLKAINDIAIAYAKNQPDQSVHFIF